MFKGLVEHDISTWPGRGDKPVGRQQDQTLRCLGGCGGIIGYFPADSAWVNRNLSWCAECAARFRKETGEDPCYPIDQREKQVTRLLVAQSQRIPDRTTQNRKEEDVSD